MPPSSMLWIAIALLFYLFFVVVPYKFKAQLLYLLNSTVRWI